MNVNVRIKMRIINVPVLAIVFIRIRNELVVAQMITYRISGQTQSNFGAENSGACLIHRKQLIDSETNGATWQCPKSKRNIAIKWKLTQNGRMTLGQVEYFASFTTVPSIKQAEAGLVDLSTPRHGAKRTNRIEG